jgi:hypothetical protein
LITQSIEVTYPLPDEGQGKDANTPVSLYIFDKGGEEEDNCRAPIFIFSKTNFIINLLAISSKRE